MIGKIQYVFSIITSKHVVPSTTAYTRWPKTKLAMEQASRGFITASSRSNKVDHRIAVVFLFQFFPL